MKRILILHVTVTLMLSCYFQAGLCQSYPMDILPGTSKTINSGADTLWILKHSQYKTAIKKSKRLRIVEKENALLQEKTNKLEEIITINKDEIADLDSSYTRYKDMWTKSDKDLEEAELEVIHLRKQRWIFLVGGAALGITVMIIL